MDRDVAQMLLTKITAIKTGLQKLATNSVPVAPESKSVSPDPEEQQRSVPEADPEAPAEEPETVPETTTRKRTTSK